MSSEENLKSKFNKSVKHLCAFSLIAVFVLFAASLFLLPKLETKYSLKQFLPENNSLLKNEEDISKAFSLAGSQPFIITASLSQDSWLDEEKIKTLRDVTVKIKSLSGVNDTLSLAVVQGAIDTTDTLGVGSVLEYLPQEKWEERIRRSPLLSPSLISTDRKTVSVIVTPQELSSTELIELKNQLQDVAQKYLTFAQVEVGGTPAVQSDITLLLGSELRNFVLLGFAACFLILFLVFQNLSPLLISLVIILVANVFVLASMVLAGFSFSILSTTIPILTTVDVVSLIIHTLLRFTEERKNQPTLSHEELVRYTFKVMLGPNMIASLTTMIGFFALLSVNVPLIKDYGITAALSIVIGWITTTLMIFPLLYFLPEPLARHWSFKKARWGLYILKTPLVWSAAVVVVFSALAFKGQDLSWTAKLFDDLPQNHGARRSTETIDKELGGMLPLDLKITASAEAWTDPDFLIRLENLTQSLREISGVGSVMSLTDLVREAQPTSSRLPASSSSLAETYFLYSLADKNPLNNFLSSDSQHTRLSLRLQDLPSSEVSALSLKIKSLAMGIFPDHEVQVSGMGTTIHQLNNDLSKELIFGFWQSLAAIALVLVFIFRSLRWALIACVPNLIPPAALLGFLALTGTPIKPSVAIIFSIALGMSFNNTVYLLERLRAFYKTSPHRGLQVDKTLWREGNPCLISSLTLLAGFSVFLASYFEMNRIFGAYMLLSMFAGLIGDLVLLPSLLKALPWLLTPFTLKKEQLMAPVSSALLVFSFIFSPSPAQAEAISAKKIGQEITSRLTADDEEFVVNMTIIEADGSKKERQIKIQRLSRSKDEHFMLARMQKPLDLKGTALLASLKDGKEEKWIYLPSSKQTRRLTGDAGQGGILNSELSMEDFDFNRDQGAESLVTKNIEIKGKKYFVVETNVSKTSASYSKIVSYISVADYLPIKAECFDKQGQLLKVIDLMGYKKLPGNKFRAQKISIKNVQNKRATELALTGIKLNQKLAPARFTSKALAQD